MPGKNEKMSKNYNEKKQHKRSIQVHYLYSCYFEPFQNHPFRKRASQKEMVKLFQQKSRSRKIMLNKNDVLPNNECLNIFHASHLPEQKYYTVALLISVCSWHIRRKFTQALLRRCSRCTQNLLIGCPIQA